MYQLFMSMFNTSKGLPIKYQKEVRRKLFQAVSDAENKAEDECEVEKNYQMNGQRAISITSQPTSSLSCALTQGFPEFFLHQITHRLAQLTQMEETAQDMKTILQEHFLTCYNMFQ